MAEAEAIARTNALANAIIDLLNNEAKESHPANGITALQHVVATVLESHRIPVAVFANRVRKTRRENR